MADPARPLNNHKLQVARLWALQRHPYLTAALFASPVVPAPGLGKVAVDREWRLYVDPEIVDQWSVEVLGSLLVHHAGHLVRDHSGRARRLGVDQRAAGEWALAADAEINDDLIGSGLRLPDDRIVPQELGWEPGRMAEEYFHADHGPAQEPDCGSGSDGLVREWELVPDVPSGLPPGEGHLVRCQVAAAVLQYLKGGAGRLSGGWRRWAEDMLDPKVDWRRVLAAEIRKGLTLVSGRVDYSYRRPSRRAAACPQVVLPALERPVPEVVVICDTSGSMTDDLLARVLVEVEGLLRAVGLARNRVRVMSVDASVKAVQNVTSAAQVALVGGGGTDMGAGLEAAARLRPRPSVAVVLTDGLTPWPHSAPKGVQVVVGLIGRPVQGARRWEPPSWARVVHIDAA